MDVESLQTHQRPNGRCLDAFLLVSVIVLFAVVSAVTAVGVVMLTDLQSKVERPHEFQNVGETAALAYEGKNCAFLRPTESELGNRTMTLTPVNSGQSNSIGKLFTFNKDQHSLLPKQEGIYFMYIQLKLTCAHRCGEGSVTVRLGDHLSCSVHLPADSKNCWTVVKIPQNQRLITQMTVDRGDPQNWTLDLNHSAQGIFLVD